MRKRLISDFLIHFFAEEANQTLKKETKEFWVFSNLNLMFGNFLSLILKNIIYPEKQSHFLREVSELTSPDEFK